MKEDKDKSFLFRGVTAAGNFISILLCALRACDVITLEWYWLIAPIFISWAINILVVVVVMICVALCVVDCCK